MNRRRLHKFMNAILAPFVSKYRLSSIAQSRLIFWNLLFAMAVSTLMLFVYLKKILFDF
jgi:hypothetical protein